MRISSLRPLQRSETLSASDGSDGILAPLPKGDIKQPAIELVFGDAASIGSFPEARIDRLALATDVGRARLRAIGEGVKQIGQIRVAAVLLHELFNAVNHEPTASLANDRQG
jgi:hypothetical protein